LQLSSNKKPSILKRSSINPNNISTLNERHVSFDNNSKLS
jgi:hypothetical protein